MTATPRINWRALRLMALSPLVLATYVVYAAATPDFSPSPGTCLDETTGATVWESGVTGQVPGTFHLAAVFANPFNPSTTLEFSVPSSSWVDVDVLDVRGNRVRTLMSNMVSGGSYEVRWNGQNDTGRGVASGVYFARVRSSFGVRTTKMMLAK